MKASELIHNGLYKLGGEICFFYALNGIFYEYNHEKYPKRPVAPVYRDNETGELHTDKFIDIEPIPLTEEILKANGFERNENVKGYQYPNDDVIFCLEELSGVLIFNGVYNDICIEYVHQLQHILRLCGLTDLADNFKVTD